MAEPLPYHAPSTVQSSAEQLSFFQLAVIVLAGGASSYAFSTLNPLQEMVSTALTLSDRQISVLQGPALYLPPMLIGIPLGLLIDRFSRVRLLAIFTALEIVGTVSTALASNFAILLPARALIGSMQIANAMNASALVAERVGPTRRGRALMILGITQIASVAGAFALGGGLAAHFSHIPHGWRWSMLGLTIPLVLVFFLTLCLQRRPRANDASSAQGWRTTAADLWHYRAKLVTLSFGPVIVAIGYTVALVWTTPILARHFKLPADRIGALMAGVLLVSGLFGSLLGGTLTDLCQRLGGPRRLVSLLMVLALVQVPSGFYGLMPGVIPLTLLLLVLCTVSCMKGIICTTAISLVVPEKLLGLSLGALNAISAVFTSAAPVAVSVLADRVGGVEGIREALTFVCVFSSIAAAVTFGAGRRYFQGPHTDLHAVPR